MAIAHLPGTGIGFPVYCKAPDEPPHPEGLDVPLLGRTFWKGSNDTPSLPVTWNLDQAWTGPEFPDPCLLECLPWMGSCYLQGGVWPQLSFLTCLLHGSSPISVPLLQGCGLLPQTATNPVASLVQSLLSSVIDLCDPMLSCWAPVRTLAELSPPAFPAFGGL